MRWDSQHASARTLWRTISYSGALSPEGGLTRPYAITVPRLSSRHAAVSWRLWVERQVEIGCARLAADGAARAHWLPPEWIRCRIEQLPIVRASSEKLTDTAQNPEPHTPGAARWSGPNSLESNGEFYREGVHLWLVVGRARYLLFCCFWSFSEGGVVYSSILPVPRSGNTVVSPMCGYPRSSSSKGRAQFMVSWDPGRLRMPPSNRRAGQGRTLLTDGSLILFFWALLSGVAPCTATAFPIYESAPTGPLATAGDPPPVIVADQSLGVKFHVSRPVTTGSIGGYFAEYTPGVESDIIGAIVRLHGPHDFPNSFDLTTSDVLGTTRIHISGPAADFAGNLSVTLTGGWYGLVFAATGSQDENNAIMPRMSQDFGDPLYFFGRTTTAVSGAGNGFVYLDGGGLDGVRMFVDTDPVTPVPEPSTLLLLGSGLAGLGGVAWRRRHQG